MATPVIMPKFGMAQEEGTIIRWLKQEGERVEKGETLLEVQTDKIDMEVEAPASGVLTDVRYGPDATVPVTTVIALIAAPEEVAAAEARPSSAPSAGVRVSPVAQRMAAATGVDLTQVTGSGPQGRIVKSDVAGALQAQAPQRAQPQEDETRRVRATPAARRLAREHGIALAALTGSGPQGRIQAADVEKALSSEKRGERREKEEAIGVQPGTPGETAVGEPLRGKRRTIASRLSQSWQNAPHIFLTTSIDLTRIDALTKELADDVEAAGGRLTLTVWIARAVAAALQRHPRLNAWLRLDGEQLVYTQHESVHLGVAVAVEDGLLVPVVRNAETLGLAALAARIGDLSARARTGQLTPDEVSGGSFTLSNLGMYPVEHFTAILNPPEVAILAVGRAQVQPFWNGAAFEPRRMMQVTLSADHRVIDGAIAAAFLAELKRLLEEPARLLL
ncbi:dihydrolipoamide acetyltransferase family protein [Caldilinea sp.]|jgi:pyruvate dehydrogenase E2 component (dihydrolipoamide acetyltransferase)|uniref:dihydrolipoamide acetyltransferase family protein n=1 Tax=Caldilinea sp. TaxID=2293560 RepID=UPI0021DE5357|nr:dihydrolipoamide acetyltransferase family protein [Caldilinea sp.]GIV68732.1 MAG: dihydrolipoamide acetyltransferase component of pyruvate dehydrogenase complex [Caldilinea sp.]